MIRLHFRIITDHSGSAWRAFKLVVVACYPNTICHKLDTERIAAYHVFLRVILPRKFL